jgi:hypothetical protein
MKAKVIREGFIDGRLVHEGEVIEVSKPGSWYVPVAAKATKGEKDHKSETDEGAADSAAALT